VIFNVADQGYSQARGRDFQQRAVETARSTPGVASAALSNDLPFRVSVVRTILPEGAPSTPAGGHLTLTSMVSPEYFETLRIPLLRGRDFSSRDTADTPPVAILNQPAAAALWPGEDPVGKRIRYSGGAQTAEVIGVVAAANYRMIGEPPQPFLYLPLSQYYFPNSVVFVRTAADPEVVAASVRRGIQALDRNIYLQSESVARTIRDELWAQRLSAGVLAVFGLLALALAVVGIYGVIAYSVNQRTREIGVRMAMGATPGGVQRMLLREGLLTVGIGIALGLAMSLAAARALDSLLFAVGPHDPLTFVAVPVIFALTAVAACWIPSRRATRVDPSVALRDE
jgi:predicted permease